jgi:Zn-dependent protease
MSWNSDFKNLGLKVGRIRGIDVYFHWLFLILTGYLLLSSVLHEPAHPFLSWLVFTFVLILSLLLHELGHCFAAYRQGGDADRIVIWPLGGLAYCEAPHQPRAQFLLAAAGPVVNATLSILASAVCLSAGWSFLPEPLDPDQGFPVAKALFQHLFLWNVFLFSINMIPCYPLDGGRMLQALLWSKLESLGHASWITFRASTFFAVGCLVTALILWVSGLRDKEFASHHPFWAQVSWGLLLAAVIHFYEAKAFQHRLAHGEDEDKIFGYDFSRGYTSLERTATREARRTSLWSSLREKYRRRAEVLKRQKGEALQKRLDDLLVKIHREGKESLTRRESRFLIKVSKLLRK